MKALTLLLIPREVYIITQGASERRGGRLLETEENCGNSTHYVDNTIQDTKKKLLIG